jgi:hypothetical protein
MGLTFNVPGTANYPNSGAFNVTFRVPQNLSIRRKFEQWSRDTFNDANSTGNYLTPTQNSTIDLIQLDNNFEKVHQYQLVGVSIRTVGDLSYTMSEGGGNVLTFGVTLAYHYWTQKD